MRTKSIVAAFFILAQSLFASAAVADSRVICVYDPAGKTGDYFKIMEDFALSSEVRRVSKIHREIYLSDTRIVIPKKLKAVFCFNIKE